MVKIFKRISEKIGRKAAHYIVKKTAFFPADYKFVSFTFDDFPLSAIDNGARILAAHNSHGTFYASLGMANTESPVGKISTFKDMLSILKQGHELGCHTYEHLNCAEVSSELLRKDCLKNQKLLGTIANISLSSFAYPYGAFDHSSKRVIANMYQNARSIELGINVNTIDLAELRSVALYEHYGRERVSRWLDKVNEYGGWLIFYTHDVCEKPTPYGCSLELFEFALESSLNKGFQIMTVQDAAAFVVKNDLVK